MHQQTAAPSPVPSGSSVSYHPHHPYQPQPQSSQHYQSPARNCTSTTQRTIPSKHLLDEKNRLAAARSSADIYRSPIKKCTAFDQGAHKSAQGTYRSLNSGPSSYESGKASSLMTASGPSSIDSGKVCYSRTSGHSSIDSHTSINSGPPTSATNGSPKIIATGCNGSGSTKHYGKSRLSSETLNRVKSSTPTSSPVHNHNHSHHHHHHPLHSAVFGKPPKSGTSGGPPGSGNTTTTTTAMLPASNSNSSITLQVTTSNESHIPSTKIFVQNSPVRSVITLENGQLTENSNVVIINNETTTNAKGELIKRTITKQSSPPRVQTTTTTTSRWDTAAEQQQQRTAERQHQQHQHQQQQSVYSETEAAYETGDSLSLISETSPDSSLVLTPSVGQSSAGEHSKFTKNVNNDATMNNSRKLSLQIGQTGNSIVYKNCLKDSTSDLEHSMPASPTSTGHTNHSKASQQSQLQQHHQQPLTAQSPTSDASITPTSHCATKYQHHHQHHHSTASGDFSSSTSNLRYIEKNEKKLNSNCDLKALHQQFETPSLLAKLNSNPAIHNSDQLAHMLHKNIVTVGSEPNLAMNESLSQHRKQNRTASSASATSSAGHTVADVKKQMDKLPMDRRFSVSATAAKDGAMTPGSNDIFTFPSLTDLSFNFTSLAAQKILQGVSLNSIDTLVELNMAQQEKQQNVAQTPVSTSAANTPTSAAAAAAVCTDYGLV